MDLLTPIDLNKKKNDYEYRFMISPVNVLGVVSAYNKCENGKYDEDECSRLMNSLVAKVSNNPECAKIFHETMLKLTELTNAIVETDVEFKGKLLPVVTSLIPAIWNPEFSDENREKIIDFTEKIRAGLERLDDENEENVNEKA